MTYNKRNGKDKPNRERSTIKLPDLTRNFSTMSFSLSEIDNHTYNGKLPTKD
jgi:hypothetical protein